MCKKEVYAVEWCQAVVLEGEGLDVDQSVRWVHCADSLLLSKERQTWKRSVCVRTRVVSFRHLNSFVIEIDVQ